jgi:ribosomal protein S18 acetylase RimI-like enzyme
VNQLIEYAKSSGIRRIALEVASANAPAIKLYERFGFTAEKSNAPIVTMTLSLTNGSEPE